MRWGTEDVRESCLPLVIRDTGDGTFQPPVTLAVGTAPDAVTIDDIQGNGLGDILVANGGSSNVSVLLQNTDGTFAAARNFATGPNPSAVVTGNFAGGSTLPGIRRRQRDQQHDLAVPPRPPAASGRPSRSRLREPDRARHFRELHGWRGPTGSGPVGQQHGRHLRSEHDRFGRNHDHRRRDGQPGGGNYIGTDNSGTVPLPNVDDGVLINAGASRNTIGGTAAGAGNVIPGNDHNGVDISDTTTTGNLVQGNFIGTNAAGQGIAVGNAQDGVLIDMAPGNTIGGPTTSARNIISGDQSNGVEVKAEPNSDFTAFIDAPNNVIQNNYIGLDVSGTTRTTNFGIGVDINGATHASILNNVIAGSTKTNVLVTGIGLAGSGANAVIQGNIIGTDATGTVGLTNGDDGIDIYSGARTP